MKTLEKGSVCRMGSGAIDVSVLYSTHWRSLVRLAVLLVDDLETAEDIVQDAFVALQRSTLREAEAAGAFLRTCVVNLSRSVLRRRYTVRRFSAVHRRVEVVPDHGHLAEADVAMLTAVRTLPARQQEVLVLRYWCDLSEADIATTLGISVGAVKSSASRGMATLRTQLGSQR